MCARLPVQSLQTTFRIVEALVEHNGATVAELAGEIDRPKSTIYDHVRTLHRLSYLVKTDETYRLSGEFLRLGTRTRQGLPVVQAATDELERLATATGEYASLALEEHGKAVLVATESGARAVSVDIYDGMRMHLHTAAPGKAILAHLAAERVEEVLDRHGLVQRTDNTIVDRQVLREEREWIRSHGYALDDEERLDGMRSVATPILDRSDRVRGSLCVYGPTSRIDDECFREDYPAHLQRASNVVEVRLNYE